MRRFAASRLKVPSGLVGATRAGKEIAPAASSLANGAAETAESMRRTSDKDAAKEGGVFEAIGYTMDAECDQIEGRRNVACRRNAIEILNEVVKIVGIPSTLPARCRRDVGRVLH